MHLFCRIIKIALLEQGKYFFLKKSCNPFIFPIFDPLFQGTMKMTLQIEKPNYINVKERDRF